MPALVLVRVKYLLLDHSTIGRKNKNTTKMFEWLAREFKWMAKEVHVNLVNLGTNYGLET